tara:strand:+ start:22 stop:1212 length:1191 start_codon:yes stop_codon:yes gene_type:complete
MNLNTIEEGISSFKNGKPVIIVDDEDRENEGDLTIPAESITPEIINFMATNARGLICVAIEKEYLENLNIPPMVNGISSNTHTAFTVSVDSSEGITTGISSYDRAKTIKDLIDEKSTPESFVKPGHIFPIQYRPGGVLVRAGHTEASVDLSILAEKSKAAVMCEILNDDGTMARRDDLEKFAKKHDLKIISIEDLISYRFSHDKLINRVAETTLPTKYGTFKAIGYKTSHESEQHLALVSGKISPEKPVLVRVHSECLTGDFFDSLRCDCGDQSKDSLKKIGAEGGVFVYMRQEGRGIGLHNKLKAYELQDSGKDTVEANKSLGFPPDLRHYGVGAQILVDLGVKKIKLLTNNPKKVVGLDGFGLEISEVIPIFGNENEHNKTYLKTKKQKLGHSL